MCISVAKLQNILDVTKQIMKIFLTFFRVKYNVFERQIVREISRVSKYFDTLRKKSKKVGKVFVDRNTCVVNLHRN